MAHDARTPGSAHPSPAVVARVDDELAALTDVPTWSMSAEEKRDTAVRAARTLIRLTELQARLVADLGPDDLDGATTPAAWLAVATRTTRPAAHRRARLATALAAHDDVRAAMAAGTVNEEQAPVICAAVDALPERPGLRELATKHLVELAEHHDARALKEFGRKVMAVVDPDAADAHEAALLEREEKDAARATSFSMWRPATERSRAS